MYHNKDKHGKPQIIHQINIVIKEFQQLIDIIELVTNVEIIGVINYYGFEFSGSVFLNLLKRCPAITELKTIIVYEVSKENCDSIRPTADQFLNMTNANWNWKLKVGHVDFINECADVTFTRMTKNNRL